MTKKNLVIPLLAAALVAGVGMGVTGFASAQGVNNAQSNVANGIKRMMGRQVMAPHVDGTITAINGNKITITADAKYGGGAYSIDASNATVMKNGIASSLSSFTVGEKILAEGTITGTNVVATRIHSGFGLGNGMGRGMKGGKHGLMGTVSAVNGATITLTGKDGKTYTVNAGGATVQKVNTVSLSEITVGDTIGVRGQISGTSVTATNIMDGQLPQR